MPGFLGTSNDFELNYHKKMQTNLKKLKLEDKLQENIFQASLKEIRKRIKPFILRRLKSDVLKELPDKIIQDYPCEMTEIQRQLYHYWDNILYHEKEKEKNNIDNFVQKTCSLKVLDNMKKILNYPGLVVSEPFIKEVEELNKIDMKRLTDYFSSAKLVALKEIFKLLNKPEKNVDKGEQLNQNVDQDENKILIFTQSKKMLQVLENFLKSEFKLKILQLNSTMNAEKRQEVVDKFNKDFTVDVLLLTTNIGGLGLSLTSANIVIMYDHDWNPMKDLQAMDRAHRIGQTKTVNIFR